MRIDEFVDRMRPVGVLYVDVHPFAWDDNGDLRFLLLRRVGDVPMPHQWQTVSGKLKQDERIADGFVRQVFKKTGQKPSQLFKLRSVATFYDEYYDTVMLVPNALARLDFGEVRLDTALHDTFEWADVDSALERLNWPTQRFAVQAASEALRRDASGATRAVEEQTEIAEMDAEAVESIDT